MARRPRRRRNIDPVIPDLVSEGDWLELPKVEIHTDGSCSPNPGRGGWAALLVFVSPNTGEIVEREISGAHPNTTNNRMEMTAAIVALETLKIACDVTIYSDSMLVVKGASKWLVAWKRKGWMLSAQRALKNADLWQRLDVATEQHRVHWRWVRGHNGHAENERVDRLAGEAMRKAA